MFECKDIVVDGGRFLLQRTFHNIRNWEGVEISHIDIRF